MASGLPQVVVVSQRMPILGHPFPGCKDRREGVRTRLVITRSGPHDWSPTPLSGDDSMARFCSAVRPLVVNRALTALVALAVLGAASWVTVSCRAQCPV